MLGLPESVTACLFDLDGVLTKTAAVHAAAWKQMFDEYLQTVADRDHATVVPFDTRRDYDVYVDGKPRADGVRSFLPSRHIELADGRPDDPPEAETVNGLGNRNNVLVLEKIRNDGVEPYEGSVRSGRAEAFGCVIGVDRVGQAEALCSSGADLVVADLADLLEEP